VVCEFAGWELANGELVGSDLNVGVTVDGGLVDGELVGSEFIVGETAD
jgi:hypothetical protein